MWFMYANKQYYVAINDEWNWGLSPNKYIVANENMEEIHGKRRGKLIHKYKKLLASENKINLEDLMKAKEMLEANTNVCDSTYAVPIPNIRIEPDSFAQYVCPASKPCKKAPKQEKENTMGYEVNLEVDQRNHLKRRLDGARSVQYNKAQETYHIDLESAFHSMTKDQVTAALAVGQFIKMNDEAFNADGTIKAYHGPYNLFHLVDPKKDDEGFVKAVKALDKAFTDAKDAIIVKPLSDALAALQAFEAMTF